MRFVSWNVNGIRAAWNHGLSGFYYHRMTPYIQDRIVRTAGGITVTDILSISDVFLALCKKNAGQSSRYLIKGMPKERVEFNNTWNLTLPKNLWRNVNGGDEDAII